MSEVSLYHDDDDSTIEEGGDNLEIKLHLNWGNLRYGPGAPCHNRRVFSFGEEIFNVM